MKNSSHIKSITQLKPVAHKRLRSVPAQNRSAQTEIYMLTKEKERCLKEAERLEKRHEYLRERLAQIDTEMGKMIGLWDQELDKAKQMAGVKLAQGPSAKTVHAPMNWKRREIKY